MVLLDIIKSPWPWYVAGPLIGLTVPLLLILGNKSFGISSSLRHVCAACVPSKIPFFNYDWKKEAWSLFFVGGILIGGIIAGNFLYSDLSVEVNANLQEELSTYNISVSDSLVPPDLFNWQHLFTLRGFIVMVIGGFLVGFGTRYAGGCTSGHSIMGIANLQWPSVIATCCFMVGGFIMANYLLPLILSL